MLTVIALGGNALLQRGEKGTLKEQIHNAEKAMRSVANLVSQGEQIVITHGNGPQVGAILLQQQWPDTPAMPLNVCGAESQGLIGYILQKTLLNYGVESATVVTQVLVDQNDPAFQNPSKPVGPFYDSPQPGMIDDAGRGYRRVVPSPKPKRIMEIGAIKEMVDKSVVIACGGGGIPIVKHGEKYDGIEAVIDKDCCAELLARELGADRLAIMTDVDYVYTNYGKPDQRCIKEMTTSQALGWMDHFARGSMRPKVESCVAFAEAGGEAVICSLGQLEPALAGKAGTRIYKG
ncbi:MAG: carbamate kinase [Candidatus Diapherotrites archaeon]|nr:carbamate kinase [Candidatus Diapherotrites archaeon]